MGTGQGLANIASHVILLLLYVLDSHFSSQTSSNDVASIICLALARGCAGGDDAKRVTRLGGWAGARKGESERRRGRDGTGRRELKRRGGRDADR